MTTPANVTTTGTGSLVVGGTGSATIANGLTVTAGGATVTAGGLTVSASGATITGNSTIAGTLGGLTGLTVASGGATVTGNSTITGTLGGLSGLTFTSGGARNLVMGATSVIKYNETNADYDFDGLNGQCVIAVLKNTSGTTITVSYTSGNLYGTPAITAGATGTFIRTTDVDFTRIL